MCCLTTTINISWEKSSLKQSPCGRKRSRHAACAPQESWALLTVRRQGASRWMQRPIRLKHTHRAGSAEPSRPSTSRGRHDLPQCHWLPLYAVRAVSWLENGRRIMDTDLNVMFYMEKISAPHFFEDILYWFQVLTYGFIIVKWFIHLYFINQL